MLYINDKMQFKELHIKINSKTKDIDFMDILADDKQLSWLKTIAAFANSEGGQLFVGVNNKTHDIMSLDNNEADKQVLLLHQE